MLILITSILPNGLSVQIYCVDVMAKTPEMIIARLMLD